MTNRPAAVSESPGVARYLLLGLAGLTMLGTALELAMERHWDDFFKLIPWLALGVLAVALSLVAVKPAPSRIALARLLCVAVLAASALGVYKHIEENHKAGALDFRYAERWESMSSFDQWWKASTKTIGPAPVLAAGILAQAALAIVAATVGHPASRRA